MNIFNILTKLANIAGTEDTKSLKEWGGDPADLEDPSSPWYQGPKGTPDRDPDEENSEMIGSWSDKVIDELEHYRDIENLSDDQVERLSEKIASDLNAPEEVVLHIVKSHLKNSDYTDWSMRQGEMGNYGESMEKDLSMESLRVLAGMNNTLKECGIASAMGHHHPASINITAGSGPELTGMLKDIMGLAGVSKPEVHSMPLDATAGPAVVAAPAGPSLQDMLSKIDGIEAETEVDGMNDLDSDDEEKTDEAMSGGFDQATTEPHPQHGPDGVRQFGDMNTGDHGDRMDGTAPRGHVKKESVESFIDSLYQEYQSFVTEAKKPSAGMTKKEKSAVVKKVKAGKDIGKPGKGFEKVEKAAKAGGAKDPKAVAAAAMWKQQAKK